MESTGAENPNRVNFSQRPVPPGMRPFTPSSPMVGSEPPVSNPLAHTIPQTFMPPLSSGPAASQAAPPGGMYPYTSMPPMSSVPYGNPRPAGTPFQRFPTPQFPPIAQASQASTLPTPTPSSFHPQPQAPFVSMGSPPQNINHAPSFANIPPPSSSPFSGPWTTSQPARPSFSGYPSKEPNMVAPTPPVQTTPFNQGGFIPNRPPVTSAPFPSYQGSHMGPPPIAASSGPYSRDQMHHQSYGPPSGTLQGLLEDFNSLTIGSVPGSLDPGLDTKSLPRPLDGDVEPKAFAEMYPMNCHSRYLRLSTNCLPTSQSLVSRWHLPLGAVVCPLAEAPVGEEVPIQNYVSTGIIRCRKCRTYVNPYVTFTDSGRKWRCNICALLNDVPGEYFAQLDASGRRIDLNERPELTKGSVEFVAPTEYMVRPPMPPVYFFLIDVSISAVQSGMLEVVAETIKSCLDNFPGSSRTQIGFITFDSTIHFYNMKSSLTQPQMLAVSDLDDIFVPLPDDLLVNLSESRAVLDAFLDSLPSMFQNNYNVESAFGPALKSAFMVMSRLGGKLLIFQSTLPSLGVGRLRLRGDDVRVYGTDKEHSLRISEDPFYKQMAADCTKYQIAINVYAMSDKYTDIASLGTLAKYTGGQVYYYPGFQSAIHKEKLKHELARDLTRETAWEAVMRIRCGKGVRFTSYHGNFMLRSTDLLALPAVDCDKAYAVQLSLEEALLTTQTVYFQIALLYTSSSGERRIRVHTAAAPVVSDLGEMYRQADTGAIVSIFCRLAIEKTLSYKLEEARNSVQQRIVKALKEYRSLYSVQHRLGGRMIYPESLRFLLIYGLALCKSIPLRGGYADAQLDERCAAGHTMMTSPVTSLLKILYPDLIRIDEYLVKSSPHEVNFNFSRLPLTADSLDSRGVYIYDDGCRFILWFGRMVSPDIAMNLLGDDFATDLSKVAIHERDNPMSKKLTKILEKLRGSDNSYYQLCHLVRQGEQPRESFLLLSNLVEDQVSGMNSYADWIMQIQRQLQ
ncbi:protein transport protein Sec24-like At3g07100 [Impatiens glandulifera]|uniref:protein transport protein Sec24-like At3g07100 n=1 Tax=Impatiens glandulifera TaxID=253017 RepID=UPI001FB0A024|nr:protein transport protein Sec24-like At3g07100 [Impatiens glandulifera]